jgi:hypothetical protein
MRWSVAALLCSVILVCSPLEAGAQPVEVELGAGLGGAVFDSTATAPVVSVRAGEDLWGFLTLGLRVTAVLGPEGLDEVGGGSTLDPSGNRAWSILADLRFHTPGRFQGFLDLGAGVGRLVRAQGRSDETLARIGGFAPAFQFGAGFRAFVTQSVALGLALQLPLWTGIHPAPASVAPIGGGIEGNVIFGAALCGSMSVAFEP